MSLSFLLLVVISPRDTFAVNANFTDLSYPFTDNFKIAYIGPIGDLWSASDNKLYRKTAGNWQASSFIPVPIKSIWQSTDGQVVFLAVGGGYSYSGLWRSSDRGDSFIQDSSIYSTPFSANYLASTSNYVYIAGNYTGTTGGFLFRVPLGDLSSSAIDISPSLNGPGFSLFPIGLLGSGGQLLSIGGLTYSGIFSLDEFGPTWSNIIYHSSLVAADSDGTKVMASFSPSNSSVAQVAVSPDYNFSPSSGTYSLGQPMTTLSRVSGAWIGGSNVSGKSGIWRSSDDGFHWSLVRSDSTNDIFGSGTILLGATNGQILKSTDTGLTWSCDSCSAPSPPEPEVLPASTSLKHPVILIHGIGGLPDNWRDIGYINSLLELGYDNEIINLFKYSDSTPYDYQGNILDIGERLPAVINQLSTLSSDGKVDILGFSMGGVVGRQGLITDYSAASKVRKFINVGVPNLGSYLASFFIGDTSKLSGLPGLVSQARNFLLNKAANLLRSGNQPLDVNSPAAQQLRIGSSFLEGLNAQTLPSSLQTYSLYGDERITLHQKLLNLELFKEFPLGDLLVDTSSSSTIPGSIPTKFAYQEPI